MRRLLLLLLLLPALARAETLSHGNFHDVALLRPAGESRSVVLFFSGDGGWNAGVVDMARSLVAQGAMVVGIDTPAYLKTLEADGGDCVFADGNVENLSHFVQAYAKLSSYHPPSIVGYSSGATLGYALSVQAPGGTFAGALLLGFCPDLNLHKPLCKGEGLKFRVRADGKGVDFLPAPKLWNPVTVLQGEIDQVCPAAQTQKFLAAVPDAQLVMLPKVGHGYSVEKNWLPQFLDGFRQLASAATPPAPAAPTPPAIADLPLVEVPAKSPGDTFAILVSGDGGWAGLDRDVADALAARGITVVGLDSLRYFWTARTPDGFAADLARVLQAYLAKGQRTAWLIGYSQGGDVLPFALNRLPADVRAHVKIAAAIAPEEKAAFEFHLANWVGGHGGLPLQPEMDRLRDDAALLCIYGRDEGGSICPKLDAAHYHVVGLPGGHHFNGNYALLADTIIHAAEK
jgi:type IV secretory pathway VirJ component